MTDVKRIQSAVAAEFSISLAEILSANKLRCFARPRQVAMYLTRELTPLSLPRIGHAFGGRHHATVMHAITRVTGLIAQDETLAGQVAAVRAVLTEGGT